MEIRYGRDFSTEHRSGVPVHIREKIARDGPKWGPGIQADVVVRLLDKEERFYHLKAENQLIQRTDWNKAMPLHRAVHPRSIDQAAPVTAEAASEQRYATTSATSDGSISRFTAAGSSITFWRTSSSEIPRVFA